MKARHSAYGRTGKTAIYKCIGNGRLSDIGTADIGGF